MVVVAADYGGNYMERQKCFSGEVDDVTMKIRGRRDEMGFCRDGLLHLYVGLMPTPSLLDQIDQL